MCEIKVILKPSNLAKNGKDLLLKQEYETILTILEVFHYCNPWMHAILFNLNAFHAMPYSNWNINEICIRIYEIYDYWYYGSSHS